MFKLKLNSYKKNTLLAFILLIIAIAFIFIISTHIAQAAPAENKAAETEDSSILGIGEALRTAFGYLILGIAKLFFRLCAWIIWLSGTFLNFVIYIGVTQMARIIKDTNAIANAWSIFRDVLNLFFIFGLLYLSITTIIGGWSENSKKRLGQIIMSALLINFSFFFTSVAIDVSNVLALSFYDNMNGCNAPTVTVGDNPEALTPQDERYFTDGGLSNCFMQRLGFTLFYDMDSDPALARETDNYKKAGIYILVAIFLVIAAIVFFAVAIVVFTRFISLIFLLIASPIMFGGWILPVLSKYTEKWSTSLLSHLISLPAMFLFLYISYQLAGPGFIDSATNVANGVSAWGNIAEANEHGGNGGAFSIILNFIIVTSFLIGAVIVGKQSGAHGAEAGMGMAMGMGAFAGRKLIGGVGNRLAKTSSTLQNWKTAEGDSFGARFKRRVGNNFAANFVGRGISDVGNKAAKSTFDIRNTRGAAELLKLSGLDAGKGSSSTFEKETKDAAKEIADRNERLGLTGRGQDADIQRRALASARDDNEYKEAESELARTKTQLEGIRQRQKDLQTQLNVVKDEAKNFSAEAVKLEAAGDIIGANNYRNQADLALRDVEAITAQIENNNEDESELTATSASLESLKNSIEKREAKKILGSDPNLGIRKFANEIIPLTQGQNKAIEDRVKSMYKSNDEKAMAQLIKTLTAEMSKGAGPTPPATPKS